MYTLTASDRHAVAVLHPDISGTLCASGAGLSRPAGQGNETDFCITQALTGAQEMVVRRLTPLKCERLQGYPDNWTNIGTWTNNKGKLHKESSDTARYKVLGNSIALLQWRWLLNRICAHLPSNATMGSLFDGIGGFPLIWEEINGAGSCLWASEIDEFATAVTKRHFKG